MKIKATLISAFAALALSVAPAPANPGVTTAAVNMRIGPGTQHAVLLAIPAHQPITIVGCLSGAAWCDVVWANHRGWVSGTYVQYYATPATPVPVATAYHWLPKVSSWVDARRDARVQYRVNRRWDRWLEGH